MKSSRFSIPSIENFFTSLLLLSIALMLSFGVARVLGFQGHDLDADEIPTTRQIIEDLESADDPVVRTRAAWWLGEHEDRKAVRPLIENGLRDASADVRLVSAWALGEIKDPDAIEPLIESLQDDDRLVREMAVLSLGEIEDGEAVNALVEAANREENLQEAIVWALGEIDTRKANRARDDVYDALGRKPSRNEEVWAGHLGTRKSSRALRVHDDVGCKEAVAQFVAQVGDGDVDDRGDAVHNLGSLGVVGCPETIVAVDVLLTALRDPDPEVRAITVWALDEINPSRWHDHAHGEHHSASYRHGHDKHDL
jgi:HEAT repeat protein